MGHLQQGQRRHRKRHRHRRANQRLHGSKATAPGCHHERTAICGVHDERRNRKYYVGTYAYGSGLAKHGQHGQPINLENSLIRLSSAPAGPVGKTIRGRRNNRIWLQMQPDRTDDPVTNNIAGTPDPPNTGLFGGAGNKPTSPVHYGQGGVGAANRGTDGQPGYCGIRYKIA